VKTLALLVLLVACGPTDIRPASLKSSDTPTSGERARELLRASCDAHGGWERWRNHQTRQVVLADHWDGWMGKLSLPWPENRQRLKMQFLRDTFYGRAEHLTSNCSPAVAH